MLKYKLEFVLFFIFIIFPHKCEGQYKLDDLLNFASEKAIYKKIINIENNIIDISKATNKSILPTIGFDIGDQLNLGRTFDPISGLITPRNRWYNTSSFAVKFQYRISDIFSKKINDKIYDINSEIVNNASKLDIQNKQLEIINNYYDCLLYKDILLFHEYYKEYNVEIYERYKDLFQLGKIDTINLLLKKREIINSSKEIKINTDKYVNSYENLKFLVGIDEEMCFILDEIETKKNNLIQEYRDIKLGNIDKKKIWAEYKADSLLVKKIKTEAMLPYIDVFSNIGSYYSSILATKNSFLNQIDTNSFFNVGIKISLPIYDKAKKSDVTIKDLKNKLLREKTKQKENELDKFYASLVNQYNRGLKIFVEVEKQKEISQQIFVFNNIKFKLGKISLDQYLSSGNDIKNIFFEYVSMKYSLLKQFESIRLLQKL